MLTRGILSHRAAVSLKPWQVTGPSSLTLTDSWWMFKPEILARPASEPYLSGNSLAATAPRNCVIPSLQGLGGCLPVDFQGHMWSHSGETWNGMPAPPPAPSWLLTLSITNKLCVVWLKLEAQLVFSTLASYLCALSASGLLFFTDLCLRCLLCTSPWTRYFGSQASG